MHILILGNDPKSLVNFRGALAEAWFQSRGITYHDVPLEWAGLTWSARGKL